MWYNLFSKASKRVDHKKKSDIEVIILYNNVPRSYFYNCYPYMYNAHMWYFFEKTGIIIFRINIYIKMITLI